VIRLSFWTTDLALLRRDVESRDLTAESFRHQFELDTTVHEMEGVELEEFLEDLLRRHADRLEQDRDRHLPPTVHPEVQVVLGIELEVEPRAAVGDDPGGEEQLARAVRLAAVVLEEHARGTMQLGNDDPLRAVDHEGSGVGHERDLAHVDLLLLHFLDFLLDALAVENHQAHTGAQRSGISQAALLAFDDVEHRRAQGVADEIQAGIAAMADDGEDRLEGRLQARILALCGRRELLQKLEERLNLGGQQVRQGQDADALGEALADAFLFGECIAHSGSVTTEDRDQASGIGLFRSLTSDA
jgi:hypothetical protein